ncbi:MAG: hypothetical protein JO210_19500, partial [Acidobacteriaceae bacterium]|nr:hypothetical protein [Acidobacteriaceae bacterium]
MSLTKRRIWFGVVLTMLCLVVRTRVAMAAHQAANGAKEKIDVDLHQHPTGGKNPVDISLGLYVTNVVAVDETRESFEVGGYLTAKWRDPRLTGLNDQNNTRAFRVEDLWTPPI